MLGWDVSVYLGNDATKDNNLARWTSRTVGVDWIDKLVAAGKATDCGGSGYPSIYRAPAGAFLPMILPESERSRFPDPILPFWEVVPNWIGAIEWNKELLHKCRPDDELLIYLFDMS